MIFSPTAFFRLFARLRALPWRGRGRVANVYVIPRAQYRYRLFSLDGVPARHRLAALSARLAGWQPFPAADYLLGFQAASVMVVALPRVADGPAVEPRYPEGLLAPAGVADSVRILACAAGYEGQFWSAGLLQATRWWPAMPSAQEWQNFQRGVRVPEQLLTEQAPPAVALASAGPGKFQFSRLQDVLEAPKRREHLWFAAGSWLMLALSLWFAMEWLSLSDQVQKLQSDISAREAVIGKVAESREEALRNNDLIRAIQHQSTETSALEVMAHLARVFPNDGYVLRELELKDGVVRLSMNPGDRNGRVDYVAAIERAGWWTKVSSNPLPGTLFEITASVAGSPPAPELNEQKPAAGAAHAG